MCQPAHEVVEEVLLGRRSVRSYAPEPIDDATLARILEAARQAPSAANRQPWRFVVIRDPARRQALAQACNGQMWLADAAALVVALGIPSVSPKWYAVDVAIALQNLVISATSFGYGTCWIGAFNEDKVKELIGAPEDAKVVAITPIGVPKGDRPAARARKPMGEVFGDETYERGLELG
jgi:nitroreductase